ncbi:hypothetical protein R3P38DRAFT_3331900 [Favolaschia claudopus]|uniref:Uncharacterized protein n=1 Tax=Favolaschia claudopus TaxID=2862362 RepID=A0AAV9ZQP7_9AGAR
MPTVILNSYAQLPTQRMLSFTSSGTRFALYRVQVVQHRQASSPRNTLAIKERKGRNLNVVFDGQIYLGSSIGATIGSLRYFSSDNQDFADVGCYCAVIQPARITPTLEVYSQELAPLDYHFFGDIIILLGSPDTLNIRTHATVHVCGVSSNINKPNSTFDIEAEQYLSATKTPDNGFPVHCVFPATPRGEKYKPIPGKGKSVSVEGFLTGLELNDDRSVTFLGNASSTAPKAEESPTRIVNTCTPARLKFTLEVKLPVVPALPNPKKRKLIDQQANEPQDKGEGTSTGHRSGGGANKH